MKIIGMIPARGGSSRFNNKPLALICGKPMVYWVWKHSKEVSVFEEVYVATDSEEIKQTVENFGGKVIMTFQFVNVDFMFGILLDNKSSAEASEKIKSLKQKLTAAGFNFSQLFPVLLTDNGGEFSNVFAFENDLTGSKETSVFFCDPNCSWQKPHVENNHTLFRNIVPKGTSFDDFDQKTVNLIFSHVNSVKRK